ncbi:uncharacterized protein LOC26526043 [Drosophila erecta]|uniref:uncharacterized protein LOC26526043 n=1 Tax=Drosophila erecta TaxID=7220 RepID=UPI00073285B3|nr:uncharacterized protein LOC26526043 [Drosophila erecta]KQS39366.1 uncharacterized protein Dere_GG26219 [Drosophila erecta]
MPPFSACSMCNVRTRKVVKDPVTLKLIYVCPKCFKSKFQSKKQLIEAGNLKKEGQSQLPPMKRGTYQEKNEKMAKKPVDVCLGTERKEKKSCNLAVQRIPKVTPPLMQTVIIKNRKYVAISETADDE